MRARIRPVILILFVFAQLSGSAARAASRPTHSPVRDARRVVPVPSREAGRGRTGHQATPHGHTATGAVASRHSGAGHGRGASRHEQSGAAVASGRRGKSGHPRAAAVRSKARSATGAGREAHPDTPDRETLDRVHTWEKMQHGGAEAKAASEPLAPLADMDDTAVPGTDTIFAANLTPAGAAELPRVKSLEDEAATPVLLPSLYDKRGRLAVPAPLYGSHEVLVHQNQMAHRDGVTRVRDEEDLMDLRRQGKLVPLPGGGTLKVDERLPVDRRYSRPWTAAFLAVLSRDFYSAFHEPLQVNSAVRTVDVQQRLVRTNGNAAPVAGETASPHLTGQAVDIGKRGLTMLQIAWLRAYLAPLIGAGKIDVEEEFQQACFHISVYRAYQAPAGHVTVAAAGLNGRAGR